jgi:hypothetical protein
MDRTMTVRQGALALLLFLASPALFALTLTPGVTITSPAEGTVVRPGATVRVKVSVDTALVQPQVIEFLANISVPGIIGLLPPVEIAVPPYEADIAIPIDASGSMTIEAGGQTTGGESILGPKVKLYVIPDETPTHIEVNSTFLLKLPPTPGVPLPAGQISVYGYYGGEIRRYIGGALSPMFGTTYTSTNPSIATVTPEGVLTPVAPGVAYVTVANRGVKAFAQVEVLGPDGADLPPADQTAKVAVGASGFRLDRATGRYLQSVTVKNTSTLPLWFPLNLIVADLPPNVELRGEAKGGRTETITPLDTRYVYLRYADAVRKDFFMPGDTLTVTLSFVNNTGVPITYTPRVYSGWP